MDDDQAKPSKRHTWSAPTLFGAGCLFAFGVVWALAALYPPIAGWNPSDPFLRVSEIIRNVGLILVAIGGLGFAYWRGKQTDEQLELTRDQFEAKERTEAAARDQDIYRQAVQMLGDGNPAIGLGGFTLLNRLEKNSHYSRNAADLLDNFYERRVMIDGVNSRDAALLERQIGQRFAGELRNKALKEVAVKIPCIPSHQSFAIIGCELLDSKFEFEEECARAGNQIAIIDSVVKGSFSTSAPVHFEHCVVAITGVAGAGLFTFNGCLVLEFADEILEFDFRDYTTLAETDVTFADCVVDASGEIDAELRKLRKTGVTRADPDDVYDEAFGLEKHPGLRRHFAARLTESEAEQLG